MDSSLQHHVEPGPPPPPAPPPARKGWVVISWVVIILAVVGVISSRHVMEWLASDKPPTAAPKRMVIVELQARYLVGIKHYLGPFMPTIYDEAKNLNRGGFDERLRFIPMAGELSGPAEALAKLEALEKHAHEQNWTLTDTQRRLHAILTRVYSDYDAGIYPTSLDAGDRAFLSAELDWFAELALHPPRRLPGAVEQAAPLVGCAIGVATRELKEIEGRDVALWPAQKTALTLLSATGLGITLALAGFCAAIAFAVCAFCGMIRWRFDVGQPHGGVYAETFALWLAFFGALMIGASFLPAEIPRLTVSLVTMPLSMIVLAWPMLRGISWQQVRADLGLNLGVHPCVEIAAGVGCYIINLPLVVLGLLVTIGLMRLQMKVRELMAGEGAGGESLMPEAPPSHPIVHSLAGDDWWMFAQIFVLAAIIAPIVEETMFRGVLHRHCREMTGRWWPFASALFSTTLVSFIFAAIHPQGLVAIPPLMFMAFGFSLMREWRGSLLPSMFAHGMSNAAVLTLATIALSR